MTGILNLSVLQELDLKELEFEYHVKAVPAAITRLRPHCGELHRMQKHVSRSMLRAKVLFTDRLQRRVSIQEKVRIKKKPRFEEVGMERMMFCMESFDDGYETKTKMRPSNLGTDLPTLLLLLDSDDF